MAATAPEGDETAALRAQIDQLSQELANQAAQAASAIAATEDRASTLRRETAAEVAALTATLAERDAEIAELRHRLSWLDYWGVDLNELMRRRGAREARLLVRGVRTVIRPVRRLHR